MTTITSIMFHMVIVIFSVIAIVNALLDIKQELRWLRIAVTEKCDEKEVEEDKND